MSTEELTVDTDCKWSETINSTVFRYIKQQKKVQVIIKSGLFGFNLCSQDCIIVVRSFNVFLAQNRFSFLSWSKSAKFGVIFEERSFRIGLINITSVCSNLQPNQDKKKSMFTYRGSQNVRAKSKRFSVFIAVVRANT